MDRADEARGIIERALRIAAREHDYPTALRLFDALTRENDGEFPMALDLANQLDNLPTGDQQ